MHLRVNGVLLNGSVKQAEQPGFGMSQKVFLVLDLLIYGHHREVMLGCCDVLDVTLVQTAARRPGGTQTVGGLCE